MSLHFIDDDLGETGDAWITAASVADLAELEHDLWVAAQLDRADEDSGRR